MHEMGHIDVMVEPSAAADVTTSVLVLGNRVARPENEAERLMSAFVRGTFRGAATEE